MKVLLVEDHAPLRESLVQGLSEEGFVVEAAGDGEEGLWLARSAQPDVIVLDLMLPKMDGLTVLRKLRSHDTRTPVLILTALDAVADRVEGLNLGADDYLPKPFAFEELLARIHAVARRRYDHHSPEIRVGDLRIDTAAHRVWTGPREVQLTAREYNLLELLAREAGSVLSRTDIWQRAYEFDSGATSNVVDVYIGYLRKKIDTPGRPSRIQTLRGQGYRLTGGQDEAGPQPAGRRQTEEPQ